MAKQKLGERERERERWWKGEEERGGEGREEGVCGEGEQRAGEGGRKRDRKIDPPLSPPPQAPCNLTPLAPAPGWGWGKRSKTKKADLLSLRGDGWGGGLRALAPTPPPRTRSVYPPPSRRPLRLPHRAPVPERCSVAPNRAQPLPALKLFCFK